MRQAIARCVLAGLVAGASLAAPAPRPTAVFTLDAEYTEFTDVPGKSLGAQFQAWARSCEIVPHENLFRLECPPPPRAASRRAARDDSEAVKASLVLFRDLDEIVYLAGCPVFEKESVERERDHRRDRARKKRRERQSRQVSSRFRSATAVIWRRVRHSVPSWNETGSRLSFGGASCP